MAWSNLPATDASDWSALSFYSQFIEAVNERCGVVGESTLAELAEGDDVQARSLWYAVQTKIETLVPGFVDTTADLTAAALREIDDNTWTLTSARAAAGLHADGFTRKYVIDLGQVLGDGTSPGSPKAQNIGDLARSAYNGLIYEATNVGAGFTPQLWALHADQEASPTLFVSYGRMVIGDYFGPWLWNEARAMLDLLTKTFLSVTVRMREGSGYVGGFSDPYSALDDAKTDAQDEYDTNIAAASFFGFNWDVTDEAAFTIHRVVSRRGTLEQYGAGVYGAEVVELDVPDWGVDGSFSLYVYAVKQTDGDGSLATFDDSGLGFTEDAYAVALTGTMTSPGYLGAGYRSLASDWIVSTDLPAWPAASAVNDGVWRGVSNGCIVEDLACVADWSGGFTYV